MTKAKILYILEGSDSCGKSTMVKKMVAIGNKHCKKVKVVKMNYPETDEHHRLACQETKRTILEFFVNGGADILIFDRVPHISDHVYRTVAENKPPRSLMGRLGTFIQEVDSVTGGLGLGQTIVFTNKPYTKDIPVKETKSKKVVAKAHAKRKHTQKAYASLTDIDLVGYPPLVKVEKQGDENLILENFEILLKKVDAPLSNGVARLLYTQHLLALNYYQLEGNDLPTQTEDYHYDMLANMVMGDGQYVPYLITPRERVGHGTYKIMFNPLPNHKFAQTIPYLHNVNSKPEFKRRTK